jgi:sugar O-acyltransferase (sialic acid O-acetyltransferase NeuD family)
MQILMYGAGDFLPTVEELVRTCGHSVVGAIDDTRRGPGILGSFEEVLHSHPPSDYCIALSIGYKNRPGRSAAWQRIRAAGYEAPAMIHPRAYVAASAQVADGSLIMACAIIDARTRIGEATVIWPGACINHDTKIGSNCFVSPNATLCGFVQLGADSFVGAGAAVADHCEVPASSFIKMMARYSKAPE